MQKCDITGKGKQYGHNVSFSLRRTKKVWKPNLQTKTIMFDGQKLKLKVSAAGIRTLKKKGLLVKPGQEAAGGDNASKPAPTKKAAGKATATAAAKK